MVSVALLLFSKLRKVRCPDDAYPLEVRKHIAHAEAEVKALEHAAAKVGIDVQQHVRGLYLQLDVANRSMQAQLAAAYKTFQSGSLTR